LETQDAVLLHGWLIEANEGHHLELFNIRGFGTARAPPDTGLNIATRS